MEIFRRAANPWGEEVLVGIGWALMWAAIAAGVIFLVVHAVIAMRARAQPPAATGSAVMSGVPARVERHSLAARVFHWTMAIAMLVLLVTAFVPVLGYQFDWVTLHWVAGLALIVAVAYHVVHALFWQRLRNVWVEGSDVREGVQELSQFVRGGAGPTRKPGKYPVAQKLYHHAATVAALAAIVTGVLMMYRLETPIFGHNPYMMGDASWGLVYVLHGVGGVALITLVITHIYFAVRPEKRWLTRSMIKGWITREEYLANHDPERWPVEGVKAREASSEGRVSEVAAGR